MLSPEDCQASVENTNAAAARSKLSVMSDDAPERSPHTSDDDDHEDENQYISVRNDVEAAETAAGLEPAQKAKNAATTHKTSDEIGAYVRAEASAAAALAVRAELDMHNQRGSEAAARVASLESEVARLKAAENEVMRMRGSTRVPENLVHGWAARRVAFNKRVAADLDTLGSSRDAEDALVLTVMEVAAEAALQSWGDKGAMLGSAAVSATSARAAVRRAGFNATGTTEAQLLSEGIELGRNAGHLERIARAIEKAVERLIDGYDGDPCTLPNCLADGTLLAEVRRTRKGPGTPRHRRTAYLTFKPHVVLDSMC